MGVEVLDSALDSSGSLVDEAVLISGTQLEQVDARRRLEDKLEELRLRREMREFDFD